MSCGSVDHDLFTGDELDSVGRTAAVLGVLTLGFESEIEGAVQALRRLGDIGVTSERAEKIIETSRSLRSDAVELSEHAKIRMNDPARLIDRSEVNDAINRGTHFWDVNEGTLVAFEVDVAPGVERAAAAIDIDKKIVTTVYRESLSDEALGEYIVNGRQRYVKLPPKIQ